MEGSVLPSPDRVDRQFQTKEPKKKPQVTKLIVREFGEIEPVDRSWLWPGYIPRGVVSLFTGDPGVGKTYVLINLAAVVAGGGEWPDETPMQAAPVLYVDLENGEEEIARRFKAQGCTPSSNIHIAAQGLRLNGVPVDAGTSLEQWVYFLREPIEQYHPAWVIIDPVVAIHKLDENRATAVRGLMRLLSGLAQEYDLALTVVQHPNKSSGRGLDRIRGSTDFAAAPRAILEVIDTYQRGLKALVVAKLNLASTPTAQSFRIKGGLVEWIGPIKVPRPGQKDLDFAVEVLGGILADGPIPRVTATILAEPDGLSKDLIRKAARKLGVKSSKKGKHDTTYWRLPD